VALEAEERRDQLVLHLLVIHGIERLLIHGIFTILAVLPINTSEVDLRTHRLKKPTQRTPMLSVWDASVGSMNPPLFLRNILNIRLLPLARSRQTLRLNFSSWPASPMALRLVSKVRLLGSAPPRRISNCVWWGR
jgi:hypothetical protein